MAMIKARPVEGGTRLTGGQQGPVFTQKTLAVVSKMGHLNNEAIVSPSWG